MKQAYERFHADGFDIVSISLDSKADPLRRFAEQNGMTWAQILDDGAIADKYHVTAIPAPFLIDGKTGKIVAAGDSLRGDGLAAAIAKQLHP